MAAFVFYFELTKRFRFFFRTEIFFSKGTGLFHSIG
ncbi:hypothetical protein LSS_08989 [Leptospira santarosai serovar Shermani str. LT 821]|uniref:Uncharacterized protein n=1 Tax=Leptospira santarosai serovar Shermani str. LT 821 TaxID=758847 RepID=K8YCE3_9LEPT|nr:hypothetical protein LSS_08989 [Leptospira santarosai serovar Shermani str. LT 821]